MIGDYSQVNWVDRVDGVSPGTEINAANLGNMDDKIKELDTSTASLAKYPTAGGTGTAITVTVPHFGNTDSESFTFIASAPNAGAATTIAVNGGTAYSAYKPNTTNAPNIISGKAYTFWKSGISFFVKASAEGDAIASQVLATKIFSTDTDTGIAGTMPNRAGDNVCLSSSVTGTTLKIVPPEGYYDGVDDAATITDPDLVPANIKGNVNMLGVTGTLPLIPSGSTRQISESDNGNIGGSATYVLVCTFTMAAGTGGNYTMYFNVYSEGGIGTSTYSIRKNGVEIDTFLAGIYPSGYTNHVIALSQGLSTGDVITVYGKVYNGAGGQISACYFCAGNVAT